MIWIITIFTVFLCSCQQTSQESHYTEVVVEVPTKSMAESSSMDMAADPHAGLDISSMAIQGVENPTIMNVMYSWVAPEGWKQEPGQGFRLASFHLTSDEKAIDCSVISLEGVAGGLEANLRRWMGQIALESSVSDLSGLISSATSIKIKGGQEGRVFDFTTIQLKAKATEKSMVVVMLPMKDATLFVKMTGTIQTVKQNKEDFFKLVKSIEPKEELSSMADPHAGLNVKDPHAGMDMASMGAMMESAIPSESSLLWSVPEGWKEEPAGHMRLATFRLAKDPKLMDCSIISLGGPAGGAEANLIRWAGQLGLQSSPEVLKKLKKTSSMVKTKDGMEIQVYDFSSIQGEASSADKSMLAAMISINTSTIFIKMTGSLEVIRQNKDDFFKLLNSISRK